jgi:hypothetical protein
MRSVRSVRSGRCSEAKAAKVEKQLLRDRDRGKTDRQATDGQADRQLQLTMTILKRRVARDGFGFWATVLGLDDCDVLGTGSGPCVERV